jgi:hypothetical protein
MSRNGIEMIINVIITYIDVLRYSQKAILPVVKVLSYSKEPINRPTPWD